MCGTYKGVYELVRRDGSHFVGGVGGLNVLPFDPRLLLPEVKTKEKTSPNIVYVLALAGVRVEKQDRSCFSISPALDRAQGHRRRPKPFLPLVGFDELQTTTRTTVGTMTTPKGKRG